jgi:spermidine synthase
MAMTLIVKADKKITAVVISGITGITAQVVLLRELLVSFQGNELSLGIILANWLLFEALGSYIAGKFAMRLKSMPVIFAFTQVLVSAGLLLGIFAARSARIVMGLPVGQGLGVDAMFIVSILALSPVSLLHGASFTFTSLLLADKPDSLGKAYVYENAGTMVGGVLVTFLLLPIFNSFEIALVAMFLATLAAIVLFRDDLKGGIKRGLKEQVCVFVCIMALILGIALYRNLHEKSLEIQWEGQNLASHKNSVYGNIAVVERGGEFTFFTDGQPIITTPFPDIIRLEEFVHFAMLSHHKPQNVAVLTGGAGGKINEILKHPHVKTIDYVEIDPMLPATIKQFPTELTGFEMTHPKVRIHYDDGRYFLKKTDNLYDVCLVGIANPTDLQTNRFFTFEFFRTVRNRLNTGGVLAISLPSLPRAQINVEGLAAMNKSVYATLNEVFRYVRVYPGEGSNVFVASDSAYIMRMNAYLMNDKIEEKDLEVVLLNKPYLEYRTLVWWSENFYSSIYNWETTWFNMDFEPRVVFASMMYFSAMFTPYIAVLLDDARDYGMFLFVAVILIVVIMTAFLKRRGDIPLSIFTTGFAGMLLDLVIIFAFQAIFGYVFYWIGVLVSMFMAGAAIAAQRIIRILPTLKNPDKMFISLDTAVLILCAILPIVLIVLHVHTFKLLPVVLTKGVFVIMSFACGVLVGAQYPLACHIVKSQGKGAGGTVGLLYGLDLFGGWAGGIIGGLFLLPILGVINTCLILAGIKVLSAGLLIFSRWKIA